jgi:hypothetical protein
LLQLRPIASAVIRAKSKFVAILVSTKSYSFFLSPVCRSLSDLIVLMTSVATRLISASGASCACTATAVTASSRPVIRVVILFMVPLSVSGQRRSLPA